MTILLTLSLVLTPFTALGQNGQQDGMDDEEGDAAPVPPDELKVGEGLNLSVLASGLNYPSSIIWDDEGTPYVALSGYIYGINESQPGKVLVQTDDGEWRTVAEGFDPPVTDITWHDGAIYVSERGAITKLTNEDGEWTKETLVDGLPSFGDHHNNEIVFGPDGRLYFGQGTTTNSGVVGLDNKVMWPQRNITKGSDTPCEDITLTGVNYVTDNPFVDGMDKNHLNRAERVWYNSSDEVPDDAEGVEGSNATTGPYQPFGTPAHRGQTVEGEVPCNGAILTMTPNGTELDWYAWGLRNPYGLKFDDRGRLWVMENQYDTRGSRPLAETHDYLWTVQEGQWYGWPDYAGGVPVDRPHFALPNGTIPNLLLQDVPSEGQPPAPEVNLPEHAGSTKFDFAPSREWGSRGTIYAAFFGDMIPMTGIPGDNYGQAVVEFNPNARNTTFDVVLAAENRFGGEFRPVEAVFGPDGNLYVVHIGALPVKPQQQDVLQPKANTGAVYVLSAEDAGEPLPGPEEEPGMDENFTPEEEPGDEGGDEGAPVPGPGVVLAVSVLALASLARAAWRRRTDR